MKRTSFWTGIALSAWLISVPAGFTWAQTSTGTQSGSSTGTGATTGVGGGVGGSFGGVSGGGVGGAYGGVSGDTYGTMISGSNTRSTNLDNAGATDRFRGQGIDRMGDAPLQSGNQFDRFNGGDANTLRDRIRSQQEMLNDDDSFQSDPYQSSRNSSERYNLRRDAMERRRFQEQQLIDFANRDRFFNDRLRNGNTTNIFIDDGYGFDDGVVDGAYIDDYGNYIGRGTGAQYAPQRTWTRTTVRARERFRQPAITRMNTNDRTVRDRGAGNFDQLPSSGARKQSMDRAANFVDANLGRDADERIDEEFPNGGGTDAGRRVDARLDPRAR